MKGGKGGRGGKGGVPLTHTRFPIIYYIADVILAREG